MDNQKLVAAALCDLVLINGGYFLMWYNLKKSHSAITKMFNSSIPNEPVSSLRYSQGKKLSLTYDDLLKTKLVDSFGFVCFKKAFDIMEIEY